MKTKTCSKCNTSKSVNQFFAKKSSKDGLQSRCKPCVSEDKKNYYLLNTDAIVARVKTYSQSNKAVIAKYKKAYQKANPEKRRALQANRRAMKNKARGTHTSSDINELFALQKGKCVCCHISLSSGYHVDHIYALINGGANDKYNLQLLCQPCNNQKHTKDPINFMQQKGFLL